MIRCAACGAAFRARSADHPTCPLCGSPRLEPSEGLGTAPERLIPFALAPSGLQAALAPFCAVRFASPDLRPDRLAERAKPLWWPMWLVDLTCEGTFEAEVGTDVAVQSSDEVLSGGRWQTVERVRNKIRWEPRGGTLHRRYADLPTPALAVHARRWEALGPYEVSASVPALPAHVGAAWIQEADRSIEDEWVHASEGLNQRIAEDLRRAAPAEHVRSLAVDAAHRDRVDTWLLLPLYATHYVDAAGVRHAVLIHGVSGRAWGRRMKSMRRGLGWGATLVGTACALVLAAGVLGIGALPLLALADVKELAALGLVAGFGALALALILGALSLPLFVAALWPPLSVRAHNAREALRGEAA